MSFCWLLVPALASLSSVGSWLCPSSQIPVSLSRADDGSAPACTTVRKNSNQALTWPCSSTEVVSHAQQREQDPLVTSAWPLAPFVYPPVLLMLAFTLYPALV